MAIHPVAMITGAGRGIGRATAIELARHGYRLALISRTSTELAQTARLARAARRSLCLAGDVSDPAQVQAMAQDALARFGRIDVLVNNAGYAPVLAIRQTSSQQWRRIIDTNLSAAFYCASALWPTFRRQKAGIVINISSAAARDPFPGLGAYGAAKAALNLLGLALAREGRPLGIRVHTIAPGAVETRMFRGIMSPRQFPASRTLSPAQVARAIVQCIRGELQCTSGEVVWIHK